MTEEFITQDDQAKFRDAMKRINAATTIDELKEMLPKGCRGSTGYCPIANFVRQKVGHPTVRVIIGPKIGRHTVNVGSNSWEALLSNGYQLFADEPLSSVAKEFARNFDEGFYPELEDR